MEEETKIIETKYGQIEISNRNVKKSTPEEIDDFYKFLAKVIIKNYKDFLDL